MNVFTLCRSAYITAGMDSWRVFTFLLKLFAMPIKEGVKPHQKLSAAGTLIDAAMDGFTACPLPPSFIDAKGVALIQSRTLSCMDATAKPPWMALRRVSEGTTITN